MNDPIAPHELVFVTESPVTSADADLAGRLKPSALVNALIQAAIGSADQLGFGFAGLQEQRLFWVLSRMTIHFKKTALWNTKLIVETWPKDIDRLHYLRDFIVRDPNGNEIALATSAWLAIDANTKRPTKVAGRSEAYFTQLRDRPAIEQPPEQLKPVQNTESRHIHQTGYADFDVNKHVTATRYVDFMCNSIPLDYWLVHYPQQLSINYLRETLAGSDIGIALQVENDVFNFSGSHVDTGVQSFNGQIKF